MTREEVLERLQNTIKEGRAIIGTGSGIGLAMTKYGVENMGGKIYFESEVNTGTTFTLELPIID